WGDVGAGGGTRAVRDRLRPRSLAQRRGAARPRDGAGVPHTPGGGVRRGTPHVAGLGRGSLPPVAGRRVRGGGAPGRMVRRRVERPGGRRGGGRGHLRFRADRGSRNVGDAAAAGTRSVTPSP